MHSFGQEDLPGCSMESIEQQSYPLAHGNVGSKFLDVNKYNNCSFPYYSNFDTFLKLFLLLCNFIFF